MVILGNIITRDDSESQRGIREHVNKMFISFPAVDKKVCLFIEPCNLFPINPLSIILIRGYWFLVSGPQYTLTGLALQTLMGMGVSVHDERIPTGNGAGFFTFRLSRKTTI